MSTVEDGRDLLRQFAFSPPKSLAVPDYLRHDILLLPFVTRPRAGAYSLDTFRKAVTEVCFGEDCEDDDYCFTYIVVFLDGTVRLLFVHCHPGVDRVEPEDVMRGLRVASNDNENGATWLMYASKDGTSRPPLWNSDRDGTRSFM